MSVTRDDSRSETPSAVTGIEAVVRERYAQASLRHEPCLCVPTNGYDPVYLAVIPPEITERDYGCGDPSRYVREGETVVDLGSGGGKVCYICAQRVGASGQVIGVDFNQPMLDLARKHQRQIGDTLGFHNVSFHKGKIQDLRLDLVQFEHYLARNPISDAEQYLKSQEEADRLRAQSPMIPSESVDVVISNCVLNLVRHHKKHQLFQEIFRVLKVGGRCVISDIVCDEDVPMALQGDADLWSGCVSGALREDLFVKAFDDAGLYGMHIIERSEAPWRTIEGIEFRAVTVAAYKGKQGPCLERNQAVIYKGPWRRVVDDDGHALDRGQRTAVCDKTFTLYQREPYRDHFYFVEPLTQIPPEAARPFDCHAGAARRPRESKGLHYDVTSERPAGCRLEGCCESTYGTMNENT